MSAYHAVHTSYDSRTNECSSVKAPRGSQDCNAELQAQSGFEQLVIATSASFAKKIFDETREISRRMTTTQKKINLDSVTAQALFKAVTQVTNEINDTMIKGYRKRNNPLKPIAQALEFYVPGIKDTITKTSEGLDTFKDWSDLHLLNNKEGWEEVGIAKGTLPKKQDTRQGTHESPRSEKLMQVMYDMKAEMGALCRALHQAGICIDVPYNKKNKEQPINRSQKPKFAGIAKRANQTNNVGALAQSLSGCLPL